MDNLISRVADASGAKPEIARQAVALFVDFLEREGPEEAVRLLLDSAPSLKAIAATAKTGGEGMGSVLRGLMGTGSGSRGGAGLMGLGSSLTMLGMTLDQINATANAVFHYAREAAGDDVMGEITAGIPGLSQYIWRR